MATNSKLPRRKPGPKDPRIEPARQALARAIGDAQFPDVLMEIDGLTRFSWILLGRPARSEQELVTLYAGLLGLGSDLSVAELTRMVTPVAADSLGQMVLRIEADGRLRAANDAVLRFMREHRVATLWGRGLFASADMMSLEATRYLWSARLDPRRRTYAVGTYAHVLDQWGILYDQPIVLNRRQAGAAIEGALRQRQVDQLERVAGRHAWLHAFCHGALQVCRLRSVSTTGQAEETQALPTKRARRSEDFARPCGITIWPRLPFADALRGVDAQVGDPDRQHLAATDGCAYCGRHHGQSTQGSR
jgi:hypothetical protein